jgi:hypothetical protein
MLSVCCGLRTKHPPLGEIVILKKTIVSNLVKKNFQQNILYRSFFIPATAFHPETSVTSPQAYRQVLCTILILFCYLLLPPN